MGNLSQGSFIRDRRIEKGLSHQQLAIYTGVSRMTIVRAEQRGIAKPSLIMPLARALDVSVEKLLG